MENPQGKNLNFLIISLKKAINRTAITAGERAAVVWRRRGAKMMSITALFHYFILLLY
jgi:hypothetical protein